MTGISSVSSLPWLWIIEYLSDFKQIDTSILNDLIAKTPDFSGPSGESARERCALRCLSELVDSHCSEEASSGSRVRFNLSDRCEDVFLQLTSEMGVSNKIKDGLGVRKCHIEAFIKHKKDSLPKCALMRLKDSIIDGSNPLASNKDDKELFRIFNHIGNPNNNDDSSPIASNCQKSVKNVQETIVKKALTSPVSNRRNDRCLPERDIISSKRSQEKNVGAPVDGFSDKDFRVEDSISPCLFDMKSKLNSSGFHLGGGEKKMTHGNDPPVASPKDSQRSLNLEGCSTGNELSRGCIELGYTDDVVDYHDANNLLLSCRHDDEINRNMCITDDRFQVGVQISSCLDDEVHNNVSGSDELQPDKGEDYFQHLNNELSDTRPDSATMMDKPECNVDDIVMVENEASKDVDAQASDTDETSGDEVGYENRHSSQRRIPNDFDIPKCGNDTSLIGEVLKDGRADQSKANTATIADKNDLVDSKYDSVDIVESQELNFCMKCNRGGQLLACSNNSCVLMVHKNCLDSSASIDGGEFFYCPFCTYSLAISDYLAAKKKVSLARKRLASFIGTGIEHRKTKSSKDKQTERLSQLEQNKNVEGGHNAVNNAEDAGKTAVTYSPEGQAATVTNGHGFERQKERRLRNRVKTNLNNGFHHQKPDKYKKQLEVLNGARGHRNEEPPSRINSTRNSDDDISATALRRTRNRKFEMRQPPAFHQLRRNIVAWTAEEEGILKDGVRKFSHDGSKGIPWKKILMYGNSIFLRSRTTIDLKDKWRNMCKSTSKS